MSAPSILTIASPHDGMAGRLASSLEALGCRVERVDPSDFPLRLPITFAKGAKGGPRVRASQRELAPDAIVYRQTQRPEAPAWLAPRVARYVASECHRFLQDVWAMLPCAWFPAPPETIHRAQNKLRQLALAETVGLQTPPTIVTNDPDAVRAFWSEHNGRIISKAPSEMFQLTLGQELARFTEPVSSALLHGARTSAVRACPTLFQALIPKRHELRVTVVGSSTYTAIIHSQETNRTRIDWRRYDHGATRYEATTLPADVARACVELTMSLGLSYAAIDLIETPDGELVFLEINPGGQWGWVEDACELTITSAIASVIAAAAHERTSARAA